MTPPDTPPLVGRALEAAARQAFPCSCSDGTGKLLRMLAATLPADAAVAETGTGLGVGAAWLLAGLGSRARLVTTELDQARAAAAAVVLSPDARATVLSGDVAMLGSAAPFDLVFCNGGKRSRRDQVIDWLTPGGIVVLDDFGVGPGGLDAWPPTFAGEPDEDRLWWLTHPLLVAHQVQVGAGEVAVVGVRRRGAETAADDDVPGEVGVGPWVGRWPDDERYDPDLLRAGDRRNVVDRYRYWRRSAVVADLDRSRHPFHVAVENFAHDFNIGSVVRTANAFNAAGVHVVGRRRWNRRGAMVTDRYMHVTNHSSIGDLVAWAAGQGLPLLGVDNLPGAVPLEGYSLPERCVLVIGQEGTGLSAAAHDACADVLSIAQYGSTRSINAGAAAAIAMHAWVRRHA